MTTDALASEIKGTQKAPAMPQGGGVDDNVLKRRIFRTCKKARGFIPRAYFMMHSLSCLFWRKTLIRTLPEIENGSGPVGLWIVLDNLLYIN